MMRTFSAPNSVPEGSPAKSFAERFVGILFSPGPTFEGIVRRPDFLAPLFAIVVSNLAVTETMLAKIGMERIVRISIERSGRASTMSTEQLQQAVSQGAKFGVVLAHVGGLLGAPILLLIIAGLGLWILNGIFGAQLNFKTAFAVSCYAGLVLIIAGLMAVPVILFGDPEHFDPQNPAPANVGFFLNPVETSKPLLALASSIDLFSLWCMGVLGVGFSEATGREVRAVWVFLIYFGLWMIWVLAKVGLAMLG